MPSYSRSPTMRSGLDAQVSFMNELSRKSYDSVRMLSELNVHYMQQVLQDSAEASRQLTACSDPFQLAAAVANAAQPMVQHLRSYQQQLLGVLTGVQLELTRGAEALMPEGTRYASAMAQTMVRESSTSGSDTLSSAVRPDADSAGSPPYPVH